MMKLDDVTSQCYIRKVLTLSTTYLTVAGILATALGVRVSAGTAHDSAKPTSARRVEVVLIIDNNKSRQRLDYESNQH